MKVDSVGVFKNSPSFSGVFFVNKEALARVGKTAVKELLDNDVVKQYTKRLDYDLYIRQADECVEWKMNSSYLPSGNKLPWVPIVDNNSLTKNSVSNYISKFLVGHNSKYVKSLDADNSLVKDMELIENTSKYIRDMQERVDWLD